MRRGAGGRVFSAIAAAGLAAAVILPALAFFFTPDHMPVWKDYVTAFSPALLVRSVGLAFFGATIGIVFAVPFALAVSGSSRLIARLGIALACGALVIPPYVLSYAFRTTLAEYESIGHFSGFWPCALVFALSTWPITALCTLGAVRRESVRLEEAARLFSGRSAAFFSVTLPLILPGIAVGWVFSFLICFINPAVPSRFCLQTLASHIETRLALDADYMAAGAYLLPMIIVIVLLLLLLRFVLSRKTFPSGAAFVSGGTFRRSRYFWIPGLAGLWFSLFVPLIMLAGFFDSVGHFVDRLLFVLDWFGPNLMRSALFASVSATAVTLLGFHAAAARRERGNSGLRSIEGVFVIGFTVSGFLFAVGFKRVAGLWPFFGSTWLAVAAAYTVRYFFLGFEGGMLGIGAQSREACDAARVMGIGRFKRTWGILFPMSLRTMVVVWSLVFVLVMGEIDIAMLVTPPQWQVVGVSMFNQLHYGVSGETSALALIIVAVSALPLVIFILFGPKYAGARS